MILRFVDELSTAEIGGHPRPIRGCRPGARPSRPAIGGARPATRAAGDRPPGRARRRDRGARRRPLSRLAPRPPRRSTAPPCPIELDATAARLLTEALPRFHPSFRFEEALAARLATAARRRRRTAAGAVIPWVDRRTRRPDPAPTGPAWPRPVVIGARRHVGGHLARRGGLRRLATAPGRATRWPAPSGPIARTRIA